LCAGTGGRTDSEESCRKEEEREPRPTTGWEEYSHCMKSGKERKKRKRLEKKTIRTHYRKVSRGYRDAAEQNTKEKRLVKSVRQ